MADPNINFIEQFEMKPNNTFFGLGKSAAHCFTIPKKVYPSIMETLGICFDKKAVIVTLIIGNMRYPASIRMINQNRSKTRKLLPEELPNRLMLNFNWKPYGETKNAIREYFEKSFKLLSEGEKNLVEGARFTHIGGDSFRVDSFDAS